MCIEVIMCLQAGTSTGNRWARDISLVLQQPVRIHWTLFWSYVHLTMVRTLVMYMHRLIIVTFLLQIFLVYNQLGTRYMMPT